HPRQGQHQRGESAAVPALAHGRRHGQRRPLAERRRSSTPPAPSAAAAAAVPPMSNAESSSLTGPPPVSAPPFGTTSTCPGFSEMSGRGAAGRVASGRSCALGLAGFGGFSAGVVGRSLAGDGGFGAGVPG